MPDLANLDQALRLEWEKVVKELGGTVGIDELAMEFGKRVYRLAEGMDRMRQLRELQEDIHGRIILSGPKKEEAGRK